MNANMIVTACKRAIARSNQISRTNENAALTCTVNAASCEFEKCTKQLQQWITNSIHTGRLEPYDRNKTPPVRYQPTLAKPPCFSEILRVVRTW